MSEDTKNKWKKFEHLVAQVQKSLAANAEVVHNDKIIGKTTGTPRQIDVSVKGNIGQYKILIAIECRDSKDPVDIGEIEGFAEKLKDIEANKGVVVSSSGFTKSAKVKAESAGIDIYRLVDTSEHDWQAYVSVPVLCDFRKIKTVQYCYSSKIPGPCKLLTTNATALFLYRENGSVIDTVFNILVRMWNEGRIPFEPGIHKNIKLGEYPTCMKCDGNIYHIEVSINVEIERNLYYGNLPIKEIAGFLDEKTGGVITKGFQTGRLDIRDVEKNWQKIVNEEDLATKPLISVVMHDHYPFIKVNPAE